MSLENKFKKLASTSSSSDWRKEAAKRAANSKSRKNSRLVALRILQVLKDRNISQTELAEMLSVSRQHVSKIVKGQENFTFETIEKIEKALGIKLITVYGPGEIAEETSKRHDEFTQVLTATLTYDIQPSNSLAAGSFKVFKNWVLSKLKYRVNEHEYYTKRNVLLELDRIRLIKRMQREIALSIPIYVKKNSVVVLDSGERTKQKESNKGFVDMGSIEYRQFENC